MERLQKVMAHAGVASRRKCEELIKMGKVTVNGQLVTKLGTQVDPTKDQIEVNGSCIQIERKKIYLFYKPKSVITSMKDPEGRPVVADYFRKIPERIYPVGRLDFETEGALLVTNHGELTNWLTHPRYEVEKEYIATVKGKPSQRKLDRLRRGILLEDGLTAPAKVKLLDTKGTQSRLQLIIHEGRNRQVRRMCQAIGHPVCQLIRTRIAFLTLDQLKPGQYREISSQEYKKLLYQIRGG